MALEPPATLESLADAARSGRDSLHGLLHERHPQIVSEIAPETYASQFPTRRPVKYGELTEAILRCSETIRARSPEALFLYNRHMLLFHLAAFDPGASRLELPRSVIELYPGQIERILDQTERFDAEFYDLTNDAFVKDLAIATHRLIPVGAELAQPDAGIPRSVLLRGGLRQLRDGLPFVLFRCGGFRPFLSLHTHLLSLSDFNPEGWTRAYHRLAELLELNPDLRGWISESWFLDPKLARISPKLSYLRQVPVDNGAGLFFTGTDRSGTSGALARSPTRRRLFAEGRYVPATYMRVWPRSAVIAWGRENRISNA